MGERWGWGVMWSEVRQRGRMKGVGMKVERGKTVRGSRYCTEIQETR